MRGAYARIQGHFNSGNYYINTRDLFTILTSLVIGAVFVGMITAAYMFGGVLVGILSLLISVPTSVFLIAAAYHYWN